MHIIGTLYIHLLNVCVRACMHAGAYDVCVAHAHSYVSDFYLPVHMCAYIAAMIYKISILYVVVMLNILLGNRWFRVKFLPAQKDVVTYIVPVNYVIYITLQLLLLLVNLYNLSGPAQHSTVNNRGLTAATTTDLYSTNWSQCGWERCMVPPSTLTSNPHKLNPWLTGRGDLRTYAWSWLKLIIILLRTVCIIYEFSAWSVDLIMSLLQWIMLIHMDRYHFHGQAQ